MRCLRRLFGRQLTLEEFTDLDDISMMNSLKIWTRSEDRVLAGLCRGLLQRELFKTIDLSEVEDDDHRKKMIERAREAVTGAAGDEQYDLFYDEPADTAYEIYDGRAPAEEILVQQDSGELTSFAAISPLTEGLGRQLMFRRLHVSPQYRDVVAAAIKSQQ